MQNTPHVYEDTCVFNSLDDIKNKKVTIMGLGLNGGGVATALFFARYGAFVTITDMKSAQDLAPSIEKIKNTEGIDLEKIRFVLGKHEISDFKDAHCVIKNPGVKIQGNEFLACSSHIESDISLFLRFTKAPIIAVTGSKGKSSTVNAIYYGLCQAGFKAFLGGNITVSPLTFLEETTNETPVVLELSSWQLADLRGRKLLKPFISVLTTIVKDHQNWYGGMEPYVDDKKLIYADQNENCYTLCKANDKWGDIFAKETKANVVRYDPKTEDFLLPQKLLVPGAHMRENALTAAHVLKIMGVAQDKIKEILATYPGIQHRLEFFYKYKNFSFYNDSASTVPESAQAAIDAFTENTILITGGTDKKCDFADFAKKLNQKDKKLLSVYFLAGTATDKLLKDLDNAQNFDEPFSSLKELLEKLKTNIETQKIETQEECVVVFSPGATSFGMFKNEFHRGNTYKDLVKEIFA